jgi:murein DD-endopeptidase MepM/ murein hydrolase activator NlpD
VKRITLLLLMLSLAGCSFYQKSPPIFIPPVGYTSTPITPNPDLKETQVPTLANPDTPTPEFYPTPTEFIPPTKTLVPTPSVKREPIVYHAQAGDTLAVVATHFGVGKDQIQSNIELPETSFINPGTLLVIPQVLINTTAGNRLLPDSEFVYSRAIEDSDYPSDEVSFVEQAGGYLSEPREYEHTLLTSGGEIVEQIAQNNSINPFLLLALLEYQSHWVFGQPQNLAQLKYPFGHIDYDDDGLVHQLRWAVNQLSIGYYGWREGRLTDIVMKSSENPATEVTARVEPSLNAGTVALQYYFSQIYESDEWIQALDDDTGFITTYEDLYGSPENRTQYEPLFSHDLIQPQLELPFVPGAIWNYTGGPHGAWEREGSWSAIDFAPSGFKGECSPSFSYVTASAPGLVVRAEDGVVVINLDYINNEHLGWVLLYLHIATEGRIVNAGDEVNTGDKLGHPSCEGGISTGTHVHMARKYNGEWMAADGPIPLVLSGWTAHNGALPYKGTLTKPGEGTVTASSFSAPGSQISR